MGWYLLPLTASFLAAAINHIDKYLIEKYMKGVGIGSLVIFSSLVGVPIFLLIPFFDFSVIALPFRDAVLITFNGVLYVFWIIPYFYALKQDEASIVSPLFIISGVFSLILSYFILGESLTFSQSLASVLIVLGSLGLTVKFLGGKKIKIKNKVLLLMSLSSLLIAINSVLFKFFAIEYSFWTTSFWEYLGFSLIAAFFYFFVPSYRKQFVKVLTHNKMKVIGLNFGNEILAISSKMLLNLAMLVSPVALVIFISEGAQPFFVLLIGILLTTFFPRIGREEIKKESLLQKMTSISVMVIGLYLLT